MPFSQPQLAKLGGLDNVLMQADSLSPTLSPIVDLSGFDVIAQFSLRLLGVELSKSLAANGTATLRAYVPWGTIPLPASLIASLAPIFLQSLAMRPARFELRLLDPYVAALRWPDLGPVGPSSGTEGTMSRERIPGLARNVDVGWRVELNVLIFQPSQATARMAPLSGAGAATDTDSTGFVSRGIGDLGNVVIGASLPQPPADDPAWPRTTLASGTLTTTADAATFVDGSLWRFGMRLDFSSAAPGQASGDAAVKDFLGTDAGRNLLSGALAPLEASSAVALCPEIAPGGVLSARNVQIMGVAPFRVRDVLLHDPSGDPILCLCAELGDHDGGALGLVRPFLDGHDFAYGVSTDVLRPALTKRWSLSVAGLSLVNDVPVDMPVDGDSGPTAPGRARIRVSFPPTVDDVAVVAATDGRGDPLRLAARQTVQLLALWDPHGHQVHDLGDLAKPEEAGFILPMRLFDDSGPSPAGLQANFKDVILDLMGTVMVPLIERVPVIASSINGFASSALQAVVVRWRVRTISRPTLGHPIEVGIQGG